MTNLMGTETAAANLEFREVTGADQFAESPLYGVGVDEAASLAKGNNYLKAWPLNGVLTGKLEALRVTKASEGRDSSEYACFTTLDGKTFRAYTPGQLRWNLETKAKIGDVVRMTYLGKQEVVIDGKARNAHQFKVEVAAASH